MKPLIEYALDKIPIYAQHELQRIHPSAVSIAVTQDQRIELLDANKTVLQSWNSQPQLDAYIALSRKSFQSK